MAVCQIAVFTKIAQKYPAIAGVLFLIFVFPQRFVRIEPVMALFDSRELPAVFADALVELVKSFPVIVHPPVAF